MQLRLALLSFVLFGCGGATEASSSVTLQSGTWRQCEYTEQGTYRSEDGRIVAVDGDHVTLTRMGKVATAFHGDLDTKDGTLRATSTQEWDEGSTGVLQLTVSEGGTKLTGRLDVVDATGARTYASRELLFPRDGKTTSCPDRF